MPYHIIAMLQNFKINNSIEELKSKQSKSLPVLPVKPDLDQQKILFSDILLILAEQIKVIFLFAFLTVFVGLLMKSILKNQFTQATLNSSSLSKWRRKQQSWIA